MSKILFRAMFCLFAMMMAPTVCHADEYDDDEFSISVSGDEDEDTDDNKEKSGPHRAPSARKLYGKYSEGTQILLLHSSLPIVSVQIYNNNASIISDPAPVFMTYSLASYDLGLYKVVVTVQGGKKYTAFFVRTM